MSLNLQPSQVSPETSTSTSKSIPNFAFNEDTLKVEIIWSLRTVEKHCSLHSNEEIGRGGGIPYNDKSRYSAFAAQRDLKIQQVRTVFPDIEIAKVLCALRRKLHIFGLAPYLM